MAGRYTVNLAVFNPEYRPQNWPAPENPPTSSNCLPGLQERLGRMRARRGFLARLLGINEPVDYWWRQSEEEAAVRHTLGEVVALLHLRGLPWLERHTCRSALATALERILPRVDPVRHP